jgi:hypothetical protein
LAGITCISAHGKSNLIKYIAATQTNPVLFIADGAAFGSEIEDMINLLENYPNYKLYLPESFEWLLLSSGFIKGKDLKHVLEAPEEYIESSKYFSWEAFFTSYLITLTAGKEGWEYSKQNLAAAYFSKRVQQKLLDLLSEAGIQLTTQKGGIQDE